MPIPTSKRMVIGLDANDMMVLEFIFVVKIFHRYKGFGIKLVQFSKMENMDDGGEPNSCPAALASLLVAEHVSSLVRFVLVPIARGVLSSSLLARSEKFNFIKYFKKSV